MEKYKITSTSAHSSKIVDPIEIETKGNTRKVLFVELNDAKKDSGETVGITIVHQRKKGNDIWEDVESIPLSSLKGGEGVKVKLNSKNTRKIYEELVNLYELMAKEGVQYGTQEFTVANANEIITVSKDRKVLIDRLLEANFGEEVWQELVSNNPDLATRLSLARIQTNRSTVLNEFQENLESNNSDESFWQKFFMQHDWIFGYGLNYHFLDVLDEQPDYGGRSYSGKGSQKGDFLLNTKADTKFTVLVEIKTPATKLLTYEKKQPKNIRNDVWLLSSHLLGAISQIQVNARTWNLDSQKPENVRELENKNIYTVEPKGILIIGNTAEFMQNESIISCFESYRRNINNPKILTFDELFERAKFIVNNKTNTAKTENIIKDEDLVF